MVHRILASIILLLSVLFMPFWVSAVLAFAGMVYFSFFVEAVILFFLSDLLYGAGEAKFVDIVFVSLIISALTLLVLEFLKRKLKFYP
ncbi:MAG: hypothetical protein AAB809_01945 [Patescibacteria group bacterium]